LEWWWLTRNRIPWSDMAEIKKAGVAGLLGALMSPLSIVRSNGKPANFPSGCFKDRDDLLATIAERSGKSLP